MLSNFFGRNKLARLNKGKKLQHSVRLRENKQQQQQKIMGFFPSLGKLKTLNYFCHNKLVRLNMEKNYCSLRENKQKYNGFVSEPEQIKDFKLFLSQ
jgi:hypothetical protein